MSRLLGLLRRRVFGISPDETSFVRRGFPGRESPVRPRLEYVAGIFVDGYHAALQDDGPDGLGKRLSTYDNEVRGFAFEGAAMGLALLDVLTPWRRTRVASFLAGPGKAHVYMVHVGVGWALARLRRPPDRWLVRFDPLLRWLVADGIGFHETFFNWQRHVERQEVPVGLAGYSRRMFDQGVGRCLWFVEGAEVDRVVRTAARFHADRQGDLWRGLGLACAYAGGVDRTAVESLRDASGGCLPQLAQGAAFAAKARERAGNPASHTELACEVFCGMSALEAADITDACLTVLPADGEVPAFEVWRRRIQFRFAAEVRA